MKEMPGKRGKNPDKVFPWKSDSDINSTKKLKDRSKLNDCSVVSDWSQTEDETCGKEVKKDIFWKSNLNINSTKESEDKNKLDNCDVISECSQTENEKCGKELNKGILWKSDLNINSTTESKDQNQLDTCSVISDWSQTENDSSEYDVGQLMYTLFQKQLYTDVKFCPQVGVESLSAHRVVLAAKCQFFADLLFGDKTKEAEDMKLTVEISNLRFTIFKKIVEYLYTDEIDLEDVPTMLDIFFGAKNFQVQSLVERCESCMESLELTEDNVCSILQMCNDRDIEELRNRCISYIQENTEEVISSKAFKKCIYNTVYLICKQPSLRINSEEQLIDAIAGWAHGHPPHIKPQLIMPLLSSIRFLTLSAPELGSIIQKYPDIMTADDALKIMIFLNGSEETRSLQNLPVWCDKNTERRCFKQDNMESILKGTDPKTQRKGKILISLKHAAESQEIIKQSSILQIECIEGRHEINAIKISVPGLSPNQTIELIVSVKIVQQKTITIFCKRFITSLKKKVFEFFQGIKVHKGRVINIEVATESAKAFSLFQLAENQASFRNEHFQCCASSDPADKKQFIISEVQYTNQEEEIIGEGIPLLKKGVKDCKLPRRNTQGAKRRTKRLENKIGMKEKNDMSSFQEALDEEITSNSKRDNGSQMILSCPDKKKCGEEREVKRTETVDGGIEAMSNVDGNTGNRMMSRFFEEICGKEDVKKGDVEDAIDERNEMPECDRKKIESDQGNANQSTLLCSGEKITEKYNPKNQEADGERKSKLECDKVRQVDSEGTCGLETLASNEKRNGNQTLQIPEINGEGKTIDRDKKRMITNNKNNDQMKNQINGNENSDQMILSWSRMKGTQIQDMHEQEVTDRQIKEMSETDRKRASNGKIQGIQKTVPFSSARGTGMKEIPKKQEETGGRMEEISMRDRKKSISDDRNNDHITLSNCSIRRTENENLKQKETDGERKQISGEDRKRTSDEKAGVQITLPQSNERRTEKESLQKQEAASERRVILSKYQKRTRTYDEICRQINFPWNIAKANEKNNFLKETLERLWKAREQAGNDRERKVTTEKDEKQTAGDQRYCNKLTDLVLDTKRPNKETKIGDEKGKVMPKRHLEVRVNETRNDNHKVLFPPTSIKISEVEMKECEGQDDKRREREEIKFDDDSFFPLVIWLCVLILIVGICVIFL